MLSILVMLGGAAAVLSVGARFSDYKMPAPSERCRQNPQRFAPIMYTVTMLGLSVLALTGIAGWFAFGRLGGWLLFVHVLAAPLFVLGLVALAVVWAEKCRFGNLAAGGFSGIQKATFWAMLLLGFVAVMSILAAMVPVFGYDGQRTAYAVHRYSALGLVIVAVVHLSASRLKRAGKAE